MNKAIAEKLIAALKSGKYQQSRASLRTEDGFCCLGVLCDLAVKEGVMPAWQSRDTGFQEQEHGFQEDYGCEYRFQAYTLPRKVQLWAEMRTSTGVYHTKSDWDEVRSLSHDNDTGESFEQIAETIRTYMNDL